MSLVDELPPPDVTPASHPDHAVVGQEFMSHDLQHQDWRAMRFFCESHDAFGYWMYSTDGSGHWTNVSERAIHRSFHLVHRDPDGRLWCTWGKVRSYKELAEHVTCPQPN